VRSVMEIVCLFRRRWCGVSVDDGRRGTEAVVRNAWCIDGWRSPLEFCVFVVLDG